MATSSDSSCSSIQPRRSTYVRRKYPTCATGPPNDVRPRRKRDAEDLGGGPVSPQSRVAPGFQSGSSRPVERVCSAREDEEKVGEAVEIHDDERGDLVVVAGPEGLALGAAADRARDVERRRRPRTRRGGRSSEAPAGRR